MEVLLQRFEQRVQPQALDRPPPGTPGTRARAALRDEMPLAEMRVKAARGRAA